MSDFSAASDAQPDFGFDVLVFPAGLDPAWALRNDNVLLADHFTRRLVTPRGKLRFHPNYGFDVRDFLNDEVTPETLAVIKAGVEAQGEQDERILDVFARVDYLPRQDKLRLGISLTSDAGPFSLVLGITKLTTDILVEV